jgi:hypothetical protein
MLCTDRTGFVNKIRPLTVVNLTMSNTTYYNSKIFSKPWK